ncbi:hypothetical protein EXIGLDRAFT_692658, partial [Exidia glandulosa HHB12029]
VKFSQLSDKYLYGGLTFRVDKPTLQRLRELTVEKIRDYEALSREELQANHGEWDIDKQRRREAHRLKSLAVSAPPERSPVQGKNKQFVSGDADVSRENLGTISGQPRLPGIDEQGNSVVPVVPLDLSQKDETTKAHWPALGEAGSSKSGVAVLRPSKPTATTARAIGIVQEDNEIVATGTPTSVHRQPATTMAQQLAGLVSWGSAFDRFYAMVALAGGTAPDPAKGKNAEVATQMNNAGKRKKRNPSVQLTPSPYDVPSPGYEYCAGRAERVRLGSGVPPVRDFCALRFLTSTDWRAAATHCKIS